MITKITISNFKKLESISFNLTQSVVIIGPNNSGKSTVFQALCLWEIGVKNYIQAYQKNDLNERKAVIINRKDLLNSPISDARFLWRNRKVTKGKNNISHVKLEVELQGIESGKKWTCKTEFLFSNTESISCRIISGLKDMIDLYETDKGVRFGFLQPISGISTSEDKLTQGSIDRKLGEGRTAEVLRNICYEILYPEVDNQTKSEDASENYLLLKKAIKSAFGADLLEPELIKATGLIQLEYIENSIKYDISSAGRGFQQLLLLLAYMYAHPRTILLLDEPDAHLEVIRQREAFQLINDVVNEINSQLIIASHSEVVLDEAADASTVIALIENDTFELNTENSHQSVKLLKKALTEIGWEKYYLAKAKQHVLYLEGSTDLQMLLCFANKLKHPAEKLLSKANVQYTSNNVPATAVSNFVALSEFIPDLKGLALFDHLQNLQDNPRLKTICWSKREFENYFAKPDVLNRHAGLLTKKYPYLSSDSLVKSMQDTISELTVPRYLSDPSNSWWDTAKLSDDWLDQIFSAFYDKLGLIRDFYKRDYYQLIKLLEIREIDPEIKEKLDEIYSLLT